jgi:hypothetical protein
MNKKPHPLLGAYAATNLGLMALGYVLATSQGLPHWLLLPLAFIVAIVTAVIWSRILGRSYDREDRTLDLLEHLLTRTDA